VASLRRPGMPQWCASLVAQRYSAARQTLGQMCAGLRPKSRTALKGAPRPEGSRGSGVNPARTLATMPMIRSPHQSEIPLAQGRGLRGEPVPECRTADLKRERPSQAMASTPARTTSGNPIRPLFSGLRICGQKPRDTAAEKHRNMIRRPIRRAINLAQQALKQAAPHRYHVEPLSTPKSRPGPSLRHCPTSRPSDLSLFARLFRGAPARRRVRRTRVCWP